MECQDSLHTTDQLDLQTEASFCTHSLWSRRETTTERGLYAQDMDSERARELLARERQRIELDEGLSDDLRVKLAAVERAEQRLAAGTYGLSIESGDPIPDERLEAVPTAERTVEEQARFKSGA